jgi:hypothetical protein
MVHFSAGTIELIFTSFAKLLIKNNKDICLPSTQTHTVPRSFPRNCQL